MVRAPALVLWLAGLAAVAGAGRIDVALKKLASRPVPDSFSFALIGDSQLDHDSVFALLLRDVAEQKPAFAVQAGDIIRGITRNKAVIRAEWKRALDTLRALGKTPYLPVPGNHDIAPGLIEEEAAWKKLWGPTHYDFSYGHCGFVMFATDLSGGHDAMVEEYAWLKRALDKYRKARATFVFMHRPVFAVDGEWKDTLTRWFETYGVEYVLYGHQHVSASEEKNGVRYLQVVSAGVLDHPPAFGGFHHYAQFRVRPDTILFSLAGPDGSRLPGPVPAGLSRAWSLVADMNNLTVAPVTVSETGFGNSLLLLRIANPFPFPIAVAYGIDSQAVGLPMPVGALRDTLVKLSLRAGLDFSFEPVRLNYRMASIPGDTVTLQLKRPVYLNAALSIQEPGAGAGRAVFLLAPNPEIRKLEWLQGLKLLEGRGIIPVYRYDELTAAIARNERGLIFGRAADFSHKSDLLEWFADHRDRFRQWLKKGGTALFSMPGRNPRHDFRDFGASHVRKGIKGVKMVHVTPSGRKWLDELGWKGEGQGDSAQVVVDGYFASTGNRRYEVFLKDQDGHPVGIVIPVGKGALFLTTTGLLDMNLNQANLPVNLLWQAVLKQSLRIVP